MIEQAPNIVNMKFGSHLYGLDTPNSDVDWKGIYLPTLPELLLNSYAKSYKHSTGGSGKNVAGDVDTEVVSLPRFIELACQGETFAIDMLHTNNPIRGEFGFIWDDLVDKRTMFYSRNLKAFVGYVKRQAAKYGVKGSKLSAMEEVYNIAAEHIHMDTYSRVGEIIHLLPINEYCKVVTTGDSPSGPQTFYEVCGRKFQDTIGIIPFLENIKKIHDSYGERAKLAKDNKGVDWKAMSHALRAGYQARAIYVHGDFEYPLQETPFQTQFLLDVKQGKLDFMTEVNPVLEELVDEVNILSDESTLPVKVNRTYWDKWLLDVYDNVYGVNDFTGIYEY